MTSSNASAGPLDLYSTLGLSPDASPDLIHQTYRRLAKVYHPDINGGDPAATRRWLEIQLAYDTLSDPAARDSYDRARSGWTSRSATAEPTFGSDAAEVPEPAPVPFRLYRFFVPTGRVNRTTYILMWPINFVIMVLAALISVEIYSLITLVLIWVGLCTAIKRLHDQGISSWFLLLSIIPIVPVIFLGMCLFAPGQSGTTKHGPQPPRAFRP